MAGLRNATVEVDLPALLESDAAELSRFVNGGRVYFEANLFGYQTSSFTTKGFFDQLGYEEPSKPLFNKTVLQTWRTAIVYAGILLSFLVFRTCFIWCCRSTRPQPGEKLH